MRSSTLLILLSSALALSGCGSSVFADGGDNNEKNKTPGGCTSITADEAEPGIRSFGSEGELDAYLAGIEAKNKALAEKCRAEAASSGADGGASMGAAPQEDSAGSSSNENITNNQEAGVDEGGIVKNINGSLVVLRKGKLYVVNVAGQTPVLTDSIDAARISALNQGVWYDEVLVKGDLIIVIGYRYSTGAGYRGATEIDSFRLGADGKLARLRSMFLESNDYYSGRNYASRMVDGKLVFYMPHFVGRGTDNKLRYPSVLQVDDNGKFSAVGPIFGALDVFTSLVKPGSPTFHTVVQCELPENGDLGCHGRSVLGSWWRETYVSNDAVYLWATSQVYRFDFKSLDVVTHAAKGYPVDQFSFRQSTDGKDLLVSASAVTSATPTTKAGSPGLLALPIAAFDKTGRQADVPTTLLTQDAKQIGRNRFIGDTLVASLYGSTQIVAANPKTKNVATVSLDPGRTVVRIEPLGTGRALIALSRTVATQQAKSGLELRTVSVDDIGKPLGETFLENLTEGEGRSHGFFFKPAAEGNGGTFGYAVINQPGYASGAGWGNGISNIGFFDVADTGAVGSLGVVSAGDMAKGTAGCETSCIDWYGNTRPIFLGNRVFALMGSELAEVTIRGGQSASKGAAAELK